MKYLFSNEQLSFIRDQAMIYQCACPAQVCVTVDKIRELDEIQKKCLDASDVDKAVHERIRESAIKCHGEMERCLEDILRIEGWDMESLEMPDNLKKRLMDEF